MPTRALVVLAGMFCAAPLRAGVYNLTEHHPPIGVDRVRGLVLRVRSASVPPAAGKKPSPFRQDVLVEVERLETLRRNGRLTTPDRAGLAACYLRLGDRVPDALRLLLSGDREDFLIQSNLAAAYFLSGEPTMAVRHQEQALKLWPRVFYAWNDPQLRRYQRCERALLTLYRSRADESRGRPMRDNQEIDQIFPRLRYVGPSGKFEAGSLSPEMRDLLPDDAVDVLTQLAVWFPNDRRLYWQLGLVLSSVGSIDQAAGIARELVEDGLGRSFKGLPEQRRTLLDALKIYEELNEPVPRGLLAATMMVLPRPMLAPPVVGDLAYWYGCGATVPAMVFFATPPIPPLPEPPEEVPQAVFNFSHVAISFAVGMLVAVLGAMQVGEWRRRRRQAKAAQLLTNTPDTEGQGDGAFHGGDNPPAGATAPADRPPGAYRLP